MFVQTFGIHVERIITVPEGAMPKTPLGDPDRTACCAMHFAKSEAEAKAQAHDSAFQCSDQKEVARLPVQSLPT